MQDAYSPTVMKELKVKIAHRLLVQLHSRKILRSKHIHEMVTEALDAYFLAHPAPAFPHEEGWHRAASDGQ